MDESPQVEDGYTRIANELLSALVRIRIPGEQMQCLLFIFRKTYGYNKKEDRIPLSQFEEATGINRPNICRALSSLSSIGIIIIKKDNKKISTYSINKKYGTWKPLSKKIILSKKITTIIKKDNETLSKMIHSKDNTKDNISKDKPPLVPPTRKRQLPEDFSLTENRIQYAASKGIQNPDDVFDHFRDHYLANGTTFRDWDAAWRTWCRKHIEFNKKRFPIAGQSSLHERNRKAALEAERIICGQ